MSKENAEVAAPTLGGAGRAARIVVAEDDPDVRAMIAEALRHDGHHVQEFADGARLLVRIARQYSRHAPAEPIDLLVSDVCMPVITGLAIVRGLRAAHSRTPCILLTAFGDEKTRLEAESLGAVFLEKPLSPAVLCEEVRRVLGAPRGPA